MAGRGLCLHQSSGKLCLFVACCAAAVPAFAQSGVAVGQDAKARTFAYEVVSVHPCKTGEPMDVDGGNANRFSVRCSTLWGLFFNAYKVRLNDPVVGLPAWANSDTWNVEAKIDDETLAALQKLPLEQDREQRRRMLRAVLAERFQLKIHHEMRVQPIYALVIAKRGPRLILGDESKGTGTGSGKGLITAHASTIGDFSFALSDAVGREVVDRTGLTGRYDIRLTWTPDELQGTAEAGPTLFTAIEEQLGLKLVSTKGPVDTIVVDRVGKPMGN